MTNITERDNYLPASEIPHYMLRNSVQLNKKISADDEGLRSIQQNQRMNTGPLDEKAGTEVLKIYLLNLIKK